MTTRNRQATALTLTCLCAALLAGCTQKSPEAGRPNTAPPSSSATPSGSTSTGSSPATSAVPTAAPTRPEAAQGSTLAAAEAFIGHYMSLIDYTYESGDTQPLLAESDKGCVGCNGLATYLRKINGKNGGLQGDYRPKLLDVKEIARGEAGRLAGTASIESGTYQVRVTPGASPVLQEGRSGSMDFSLSPSAGNWVMFEMQLKE